MSVVVRLCTQCQTAIQNPAARNCSTCGAPAVMVLQAGAIIGGQYKIVRPIKSGGAGALYLAEDIRTFNRRCVVKHLLAAHDPGIRASFASEVQTVTGLRHPQIPQIYAYIEDQDTVLIVMEYIAGTDLEQGLSTTLPDGRFRPGSPRPLAQVLRDGMVACSILEHLHSRTPPVVHCDVKPANLIHDDESNALFLVDFGAAAASGAGENYGTPGYAPPELYRGQRMPASDVYALGATLYHLLTDDDPTAHPGHFPKLDRLPAQVAEVLGQTLRPEPGMRPPAHTLRAALERCLNMPSVPKGLVFPLGATPRSIEELVEQIQAHWAFSLDALEVGDIELWLRANGHLSLATWIAGMRANHMTSDFILDELMTRINPNRPQTEVRLGQQALELALAGQNAVLPLVVVARGGMARLEVHSAPSWLQYAPSQMVLQPEVPQSFHFTVDHNRLPRGQHRGSLVLMSTIGGGQQQRIVLPVNVGPDSQGNPAQAIHKPGINFLWLIAAWGLLGVGGLFMALLYPQAVGMIVQLCLGGSAGVAVSWVTGSGLLKTLAKAGIGGLGAVAVGTIVISMASAGKIANTSPVALFAALIAGAVTSLVYSVMVD